MIDHDRRLRALEQQVRLLDQRIAVLARRSDRFSSLRLWIVVLGLPLVWGAFWLLKFWFGFGLGLVLAVAFGVVVWLHRRVDASKRDHALYRATKAGHIARMRLDWDALPAPYEPRIPSDHPFATDLDLTGPYSLHRLIDTASTREGSQRLLDWLLSEIPDPVLIARRQALIRELRPMRRFRDRLTLAARRGDHGLSAQWSGEKLARKLAETTPPDAMRSTLRVLLALAALNVVLLALDVLAGLPPLWIITLLAYTALTVLRRDLVGDLFADALYLADALRRLGAVMDFLEQYPYTRNSQLRSLCAPLLTGSTSPSAYLRWVGRLASAASLQANFFLWLPVNILLPWDVLFAYRLNRHRTELAALLPDWLDVWAEVEALSSLAVFAYLNPGYTFPVVHDGPPPGASEPVLEARQLGHPLIPHAARVCNNFALRQGQIVIITGSNMSGKSSFLRTVGVNMVLAYAGGVVNAESLTLSLFRLFTSIRVTDSVVDGISYFYAEVRRLRALLDALEAPNSRPLFFLIDEIFRGTNNRERLIGSRAYIRALGERRGTGLVSTHDLELIHLADELPAVRNQHFRESVADGRMHFDYVLKDGPSPTTNALVIMAMEGLPVGLNEA